MIESIKVYTKYLTVKEWKKFDHIVDQENDEPITAQEILLRKYKIILTDHQTRKEKFNHTFDRIFKADIDKTLTKVTKNLDDFHNMMDNMHGIGGKQKDLSGLLYHKPKTTKTKKRKGKKISPEIDRIWNSKGPSLSGKGLKLR